MTTWPWSSSVSVPSSSVSDTACSMRSATCTRVPSSAGRELSWPEPLPLWPGASEAGKDSSTSSSTSVPLPSSPGSGSGSGRMSSSAPRKADLDSGEAHAVLRALRAGERRDDLAQVELERLRVGLLLGVGVVPQALRAGVGLDDLDLLLAATRELEVAQRLLVDREDRARRAELRAHVADRRAVGQRQVRDARAVELDELAHDAVLAQALGDRQDEVGGGRALGQLAAELEADHARDQHRHRLAEHRRLGLDAADAPAEHADAVDHRRVAVGTDERVRIEHAVLLEDHAREVLEVDLMDDADVRRDDDEALERRLAPAQEAVALLVALELTLGVEAERVARAERVHLHRVIDHELGRHQRVDLRGIAAHLGHRVAQRREVDHRRHAGEVLHHHARGRERDLLGGLGVVIPARQRLDVLFANGHAVLGPQQVLKEHLEAERQPRNVEFLLERVQAIDLIGTPANLKVGAGVEGIV